MQVRAVVLLVLVHIAFASDVSTKKDVTSDVQVQLTNLNQTRGNDTIKAVVEELKLVKKTRRKGGKKSRSTSSSSGEKDTDSSKNKESLNTGSSDDSDESTKKTVKLTDGVGWRRWHRKCTPCPKDMVKKWRDPSISWICGGYQRARRSFKSACMMYYRNCQDGTMFVKLHDHRCENSTGTHFFYDYRVKLSDTDSSKSESSSPEISEDDDDDSSDQ